MNRFLITFVSIIVVVLLTALGYFIFQNQKLIGQLSKSPLQAQSPALTSSPAASPSPQPLSSPLLTPAVTQNAIKTNIAAKNYQGLIPYMTNPVEVILEATECCGSQTPQESVEQMSYIDEGIPFDFNQNLDTIKNLKAKNQALEFKYIGISQVKEHLVAFSLNPEGKITDILMAITWKLYNN